MCISSSSMVVYYAGVGAMPKGKRRQRNASPTTIVMRVDVIFPFTWILRYSASMPVFFVRMYFKGHLVCMAAIT